MAGAVVDGGPSGGRRSLDSEINMIPMIDLLMVTITFLLITAVWSHMARLAADAKVPGDRTQPPCEGDCAPHKALHVDMRSPDRFVLSWKDGATVVSSLDVPRASKHGYGELTAAVERQWEDSGAHKAASDRATDRAVLHTADDTRYEDLIGAMDAIYAVKRPVEGPGARQATMRAFFVELSAN